MQHESVTIEAKTVLVYVCNIDERYARKDQLQHCKDAVKQHELPAIGRSVYEHDELDALIDNLRGRGTELVMLPRLSMLAVHRGRGVGNRFLKNLLRITTRKASIMDISEGITTYDYKKWMAHIDVTENKLVNGRSLSTERSKQMRTQINERGLANHWTEHIQKTDPERFNRLAQHWRDPRLTAKEAIEQSPDPELKNASRRMWERIFSNRT